MGKKRIEISPDIVEFLEGKRTELNEGQLLDDLLTIPPGSLLPQELFSLVPEPLDWSNRLNGSGHEQDMLFLSLITAISGTLVSGITGEYHSRLYFPNINLLVLASPGTGKGSMRISQGLFKKIDESSERYYKELINSISTPEAKNNIPVPHKMLIPGNASNSALIERLRANGGNGFMLETEIDTVSQALSQDWGGFSDILRASFEHEKLDKLRIGSLTAESVQNTRFSSALSGTPNQLKGLVRSIDDGLFSRMLFYLITEPPAWRDWEISEDKASFSELEAELAKFGQKMLKAQLEARVDTGSKQNLSMLNHLGKGLSKDFSNLQPQLIGVAFRAMASIIKIGLTLCGLRAFSEGRAPSKVDLKDLVISAYIVGLGLSNARYLAQKMGSFSEVSIRHRLLQLLPDKFDISAAYAAGELIPIESRTVKKHLSIAVENGELQRIVRGLYQKVNESDVLQEK